MKVAVALALARRQAVVELELADGATVADAVAASGLGERFPELDLARLTPGIWSRACAWDTRLRDGDRVELYRGLEADAKQMRRARAAKLKRPSPRPSPKGERVKSSTRSRSAPGSNRRPS